MSAIRSLIDEIRAVATSSSDLGSRFEELIRQYFLHDPLYIEQFSDVWLWNDWKERGKEPDTGIDLVAKNRDDDGYTAIQCKCYAEDATIQRSDIDSFLVRSAKKPFTRRILVATVGLSRHAENVLEGLSPEVQRIGIHHLEESAIDWSNYDINNPKVTLKPKKKLRPHQEEALADVRKGFKTADRGKLIMACGTGKTFTSLKIAEEHAGKNGLVLFLVPSLSLLDQTLREWVAESALPLHCYAVCSDATIGTRKRSDDDLFKPSDLAIPATTDGKTLANNFAGTLTHSAKMTVVFSTYQSIDAIHLAQSKHGMPEFDIIICDEAHRTTGAKVTENKPESKFVRVHDAKFIKAKKRLYMTATPRLYTGDTKKEAAEKAITIWSMDDESIYGQEFHYLNFGKAVEQGLLSDYKVLVLTVNEQYINHVMQALLQEKKRELKLSDVVKIVGCWNGLSLKTNEEENNPPKLLQRAVAFSSRIGTDEKKDDPAKKKKVVKVKKTAEHGSKEFVRHFKEIIKIYLEAHPNDRSTLQCELDHIDGTMDSNARRIKLDWLKIDNLEANQCRILSNAKCLSEGVDVPALDAVIFLNPRKSIVDVVQSVGRVMRTAPGKKLGYIILPIGVPTNITPETALENNEQYKEVWDVLKSLRAHDERLDVKINNIGKNKDYPDCIDVIGVGFDKVSIAKVEQQMLDLYDIETLKEAIYAKIVQKCGREPYWDQWAKDIADIAQQHIKQIKELLQFPQYRESFDRFWNGLKQDLNPDIAEDDVIEMLSQHLITKPVFDALFEGFPFSKENPVSQSLDAMIDKLVTAGFGTELEKLEKFYDGVRRRVQGEKTAEGRQQIIIKLYDQFFKTAFPRMAQRLGIVYTPVEVIDFILKSVDQALRSEFNVGIGAKDVHVLDPFTGTGTFLVRLLQSGLIDKKDLKRKYTEELHANEVVLLAYYIAAINIENTYREQTSQHKQGEYEPFGGIVLADTFRLMEDKQQPTLNGLFQENTKRVLRQKETPITVIISNPPYSAGQKRENDANKNTKYEQLDERIRTTYAESSTSGLKRNLYDSYIRAFRWASDRIGDKGIVCYVSNGAYIDGSALDGFRKCLAEEFTDIFVFNLRGNVRTADPKKEGQNVFPIMTPVAITLLVKNPAKKGNLCTIHYRDIGDYHCRNTKLQILSNADGLKGEQWQIIMPNEKHDWVNQRGEEFDSFISLGDRSVNTTETIFNTFSLGVVTNRDAWCWNFAKNSAHRNMSKMITFYNKQVTEFIFDRDRQKEKINVDKYVDNDPKKISWTRSLKKSLSIGKKYKYQEESLFVGMYRPFCKQSIYFNRAFNECVYQMPLIFPSPRMENVTICICGVGAQKKFSALITNVVPDLHTIHTGRCFPLYTYEKVEDTSQTNGLKKENGKRVGNYIRRENISDAMLQKFREHYSDKKITKEDIFYYVYGILHSASYRERFASDLKKQLPRIPLVDDFRTFSQAGRKLADLHLNYETGKMYPLQEIATGSVSFKVVQMKYPSKTDKSKIIYNGTLHLAGIPAEAYRYIVNGKSALDWIVERYAVTTHKDSGIVNDPNDWCREIGNERYIVDLIKRIVHLSVESVKIIEGLPEVTF